MVCALTPLFLKIYIAQLTYIEEKIMANTGSKFLSVMVVGNEPEKLMEKYSKSLKVKPYVKYKYLDASKLKEKAASVLEEIVKHPEKFSLSSFQIDYFKERLKAINAMSPFEYYSTITNGLYYDEQGNALSEENPDGKWDTYSLGKNFSYPLRLKDGSDTYQARSKDVDWEFLRLNHNTVDTFAAIWKLVVEGKKPSSSNEEKLKSVWANNTNYLSRFKSMDDFISHNCAYWNYAFLDENGWVDMDAAKDETEWINNFYERFILHLKDDDLVTIYEYSIMS